MVDVPSVVMHPVTALDPVEWNPNQESDASFAALVDNIKQIGFVEPILVVEREGRYRIVSGEHRWRAAQLLKMKEVPCIEISLEDDDVQKLLNVRMNMLRGQINPYRFTKIFNDLSARFGPDAVRRLMAVTEDKDFKRLYRDVRQSLPPEARARLDKTKKEIHDVDDLAEAIRGIFANQSSRNDSFLLFQYGGKTHMMVKCTARTLKNLKRIAEECEESKADINDRMNELLEAYKHRSVQRVGNGSSSAASTEETKSEPIS